MIQTSRLLLLMAILTLTSFSPCFLNALPLQSDHTELVSVPSATPPKIDGNLDDWDLSGEMFVYPARSIRERYSARMYSMYDKDYLYIGVKWRDPSPMVNNVDADGAPGDGWMADCLQMRLITDIPQIHLTTWYSSKKDKAVFHGGFGTPFDNLKVFRGEGKKVTGDNGFEMVFKEDADKRGYAQEIKIPWKLIYKDPAKIPKPGETFGFTGELYWGGASGTTWPGVQWSDPMNPAQPQRVVIYLNPNAWGKIRLAEKGNLPKTASNTFDDRLQGLIPLRVKLPPGSTKFTLVIDDQNGKRVRNLIAHADVEPYLLPGKKDEVEVMWDGRRDGEWDKKLNIFVGDVLPAGVYTVKGLAHTGVGVVHAGSYYCPITPSWPTGNGIGSWIYDHALLTGLGVMPSTYQGRGKIFVGAHNGECGVGFIVLDQQAQKIGEWLRRGAGAYVIATGPKYVYFGFDYNGISALGRVNPDPDDKGQLNQVPWAGGQPDIVLPGEPKGMAYVDGKIAVAIKSKNVILLFDGETGAETGKIEIPAPSSLAATPEGALVVVSGEGSTKVLLAQPKTGKSEPLTLPNIKPRAVAVDSKGHLYVSDTADEDIKVFEKATKDAKLLRTLGEKGGILTGPWNTQRMNVPLALAVEESSDGKTSVWAAESSFNPKRLSVWDAQTGKNLREMNGGTSYSGSGGFMSDHFADMGFYRSLRMKVNHTDQSFTMEEVLDDGRPLPDGKKQPFRMGAIIAQSYFGNMMHGVSKASGKEHEYIFDAYGVHVKKNGKWQPAAAFGSKHLANSLKIPVPQGATDSWAFLWNDLNEDGFFTEDEIKWKDMGKHNMFYVGWGGRPDTKSLAVIDNGMAFKPVRFTSDGAPVYDLEKGEPLPGDAAKAEGQMWKTRFGWLGGRKSPQSTSKSDATHGLFELTGYDEKGSLRWTYPNYWVGVHGGMTAPQGMPGVVMGYLKIPNVVEMKDYDFFSIRNNMGQEHLIRDDGTYIGELFTDQRAAPGTLPETRDMKQVLGIPINDTSMGGECFSGWIARQNDGRVRMTYGHVDVRIAEVIGLDSIKDIQPITVDLTPKLVAEAKTFKPRVSGDEKTTLDIAKGGPIAADAKLFEGPEAISVKNGREEVGKALLQYDDKNLYVAWRVFDTSPFQNLGKGTQTAFKTGDSVNVFIAPDGKYSPQEINGVRVLLAPIAGKNAAMVYKPKGSGKEYEFKSPVRSSKFGYVAEEATIKYDMVPGKIDYFVSATIPWSVLGITPKAGMKLKGDIGILFADQTNGNIGQRVQWVDKETNVVNDEPTEAEFFPGKWGEFILK